MQTALMSGGDPGSRKGMGIRQALGTSPTKRARSKMGSPHVETRTYRHASTCAHAHANINVYIHVHARRPSDLC